MAEDIVKEMYINESAGNTRLAIVENGRLVELYVERPEHQRMVGSIYKGVVENVIPGMQAAFVDIGYEVNAFLPFSEIGNPNNLEDVILSDDSDDSSSKPRSSGNNRRGNRNSPRRSGLDLKSGQEILVQVIKEPFAGKGPRVTTDIAIPGRLLVLVHNADFIGISKKIFDKYEVRRLRKQVESLKPDNFGVIVRTVAESKDQKVLKRDFARLWAHWQELEAKSKSIKGAGLVYKDLTTTDSVIRDLLTQEVDKVIVDSKDIAKRLGNYLKDVSPAQSRLLELYRGKSPIFSVHDIEGQIDKSLQKKVWLKSGGHLILEHTEAMMVVDVNSGRFIGKRDHEQNSLKINLEAAREVAKQLRLRDIGGLIIIDFIDMRELANRRRVYNELIKDLKLDRAKVAVSPISEFGLLEMTRERVRLSLLHSVSDECPTCHGLGRVPSKDSMITKIDSWLKRFRSTSRDRRLVITLQPDLAKYIQTAKAHVVKGFMWQHWVWLEIKADATVRPDEFRVYSKRRNADVTDAV